MAKMLTSHVCTSTNVSSHGAELVAVSCPIIANAPIGWAHAGSGFEAFKIAVENAVLFEYEG